MTMGIVITVVMKITVVNYNNTCNNSNSRSGVYEARLQALYQVKYLNLNPNPLGVRASGTTFACLQTLLQGFAVRVQG